MSILGANSAPRSRTIAANSCRLLLLLALSMSLVGCFPQAVWLPDSSGLIYTGPDRQLIHYDLASGKLRTFRMNAEVDTDCPAISPDGKRIAVCRKVRPIGRPATLEVILYDLQGKELGCIPKKCHAAGFATDSSSSGCVFQTIAEPPAFSWM